MDFQTFKTANLSISNLSREVKNLRYEHYEKLRNDTLQALKEERNIIIEEQKMDSESKTNVNYKIKLFRIGHNYLHKKALQPLKMKRNKLKKLSNAK